MPQYSLNNNKLILKVKKASLFVRIVMYIITASFFILPLVGIIISVHNVGSPHFKYLITIAVFGLLGFYMLRVSL
jgi:hypothetical protein